MRSSSQKSITFTDIKKKTRDREEKTSKNNLYNKKLKTIVCESLFGSYIFVTVSTHILRLYSKVRHQKRKARVARMLWRHEGSRKNVARASHRMLLWTSIPKSRQRRRVRETQRWREIKKRRNNIISIINSVVDQSQRQLRNTEK